MFRYFKLTEGKLLYRSYLIIFAFFIATLLEILAIGTTLPLIATLGDIETFNINSIPFLKKYFYKFTNSNEIVLILVTLIFIFIAIKNLLLTVIERAKNRFRKDLIVDLTSKLLKKYLNQDLFFHIKKNSSYLIKNIREDCLFVVSAFIYLLRIFSDIFIFLFFSTVLIISNMAASITMILIFIIFFLSFTYFTMKHLRVWGKERFKHSSIANKYLTESILNFKEVKLYNAVNFFIEKYKKSVELNYDVQNKFDNYQAYPRLILEIVVIFLITIFLFFLTYTGTSREVILLQISFFFIVGIRLSPVAVQIYRFFQTHKYTIPTLERISFDLSRKDKNLNKTNNQLTFNNKININNMDFEYENKKKVINNLTFSIKKNDFIGIFGKSGSGKTTLLEIILGLLPPNKGNIRTDGIDISLNYLSWFNNLGYIPQKPIFLDDTIIKNILFDKKMSPQKFDKIFQCLRSVNLNFTKKKIYNFKIGESGKKLSEGQRQRLAIARSLFKNPKILFLDEITSALDSKNEMHIIKLLKKLNKKTTIIFVSHKKTSLKFCNKLFEFKNGKLKKVKN